MGVKNHIRTTQLEVLAEQVINEYLDSKDFTTDIGVAWAHIFESTKRIFRKVYPNMTLSLCSIPKYTRVVI